MNGKCFFYKEDECGLFTKPRIPIDGLFSRIDLDNDVEHHLSIIKTEKSQSIDLLTDKGLTGEKVSQWG